MLLKLYKDELKSLNEDIIFTVNDFLLQMRFKHCNTDGRSVQAARENMFKK